MKIIINGINANLRFSSAHLIPCHESCGFIHGHSYFVDAEVEGERFGDFSFVVDFKDVKKSLNDICKSLDHRLLIPIFNEHIKFKDMENVSLESFNNAKNIQFHIENKGYTIPKEDTVLLPLKTSSAEDLATYFTENLLKDLKAKGYTNITSVSVCVNEGIGQGAQYSIEIKN